MIKKEPKHNLNKIIILVKV